MPQEQQGAAPNQGGRQRAKTDIDLLIKGGTVVDPSQKMHALMDVAVKDGKILEVSKDIPESRATTTLSAKDRIVTPGIIDIHVYCFDGSNTSVNPDHSCLARGVTTVVDAGTAGSSMITMFRKYVVQQSTTRVVLLVDIGAMGTVLNGKYDTPDEMKNWVNPQATAQAVVQNRPVTVGLRPGCKTPFRGPTTAKTNI